MYSVVWEVYNYLNETNQTTGNTKMNNSDKANLAVIAFYVMCYAIAIPYVYISGFIATILERVMKK